MISAHHRIQSISIVSMNCCWSAFRRVHSSSWGEYPWWIWKRSWRVPERNRRKSSFWEFQMFATRRMSVLTLSSSKLNSNVSTLLSNPLPMSPWIFEVWSNFWHSPLFSFFRFLGLALTPTVSPTFHSINTQIVCYAHILICTLRFLFPNIRVYKIFRGNPRI